ncbi:MAG TPA: zinc ribbon domain-containing protein [Rhodanobacteraceae bacterium]|nr:zinc ribbon domain-containing protein [Rhodanobacteraceae bacterium]
MALECTLASLASVDQTDPEAVQALLQQCTSALLDPALWEWALGLTLACALIGAGIGWVKGRWLAGLVWGAALGPIGWLVVALSKSGLQECPECGRRNRADAKVCRFCGIDFRKYAGQTSRSKLKAQDSARGW